jgi:glycine/D-amino acid oxidase-like deaminating enzyme
MSWAGTGSEKRSAIIAGGGVFGCSAAVELRRRGWGVALLDAGPIPRPEASSTDISKIIRADYGADDFHIDFAWECLQRWRQDPLFAPLYHEAGFLVVEREPMRPGGFEALSFESLSRRDVPGLERMTSARLAERFPAWKAENWTDGYFNPCAGWAESGAVVTRLAAEARTLGARVIENAPVACLLEKGSRVVGVETAAGEKLLADCVILATGAWTPALLPEVADRLRPVGQPVLHFQIDRAQIPDFQPPRFACWAGAIEKTGWYGFPALDDGRVKVGHHGAGLPQWRPGDASQVPASHVRRCREFLRETLPALADAPLAGSRVCFYCDSRDGRFHIARHPDRPGLMLSTGGSGHGFKFAPLLGEIAADVLEDKPNRWAPAFAWREPGDFVKESARCLEAPDGGGES